MDDFDEEELTLFVNRALAQADGAHPFSASPLGLAETDLFEKLHQRLAKKIIESEVNDIFQDVRADLISRKVPLTLKEVHTVTRNCQKCGISAPAELPKWNIDDPDIVVVIESSSLPPEAINIMIDGFKNAGIGSGQLCLTYVNRCPVQRPYSEEEIKNCVPYLHSEIQILNPKLIVCLGTLPASVLFGTPFKMKDIRGEIRWLGFWPILSTYSPMYVSKSSQFAGSNILQQFQQDIIQAKKFLTTKSA